VVICFLVFGCQHQCNRLPGKTCLRNDLLCVEWDVKPYTLTHSHIQQVAQLWQRDRASLIDDFKGWVNSRLNYRLKGYVSRYCDMTQFMLTYSILKHVYVLDGTHTLCEKCLAAGARPKVSWCICTTGRCICSTWTCSCR